MILRQHGDGLNDEASNAVRKDCSEPVMVRPEYAPDTDVRTILRRHGGLPAPTRQPQYTETDYDIDLTKALTKIKRARDAFDTLPQAARDKYKTADNLWDAYRRDEIRDEPLDTMQPADDNSPIPQQD